MTERQNLVSTTRPLKILVVDDEPHIVSFLRMGLEHEGFVVAVAREGMEALTQVGDFKPDLVILDLMLPGINGMDVAERLRRDPDLLIIMLTAKDQVSDRIAGLRAGADDYLIKPFSFSELLARIRALARRSVQAQPETELQVGGLVLDLGRHEARRDDKAIDLTAKEFQLLEYLMRNSGHVLTRTQILDHVWGYNFDSFSNVVDIYVHYLRNKIDRDFPEPMIRTVRGVGYSLKA